MDELALKNFSKGEIDISNLLMYFFGKNVPIYTIFKFFALCFTIGQGGYEIISIYRSYQTTNDLNLSVLKFSAMITRIFSVFYILFGLKWKYVVHFIQIWSKTGLRKDCETTRNIHLKRRKFRIILGILSFTSIGLISLLDIDMNADQISNKLFRNMLTIKFILKSLNILLSSIVMTIGIDFLLQVIIHIQAVFIHVNLKINCLRATSEPLNETIKSIRKLHFYGCELTRTTNKLIGNFITGAYCATIPPFLLGLYRLIYLSETILDRFISFNILFISISTVLLLTLGAITVNNLASKCYNKVYKISFSDGLSNYYEEISLLLDRMGRYDVGLTFGNLCIISSSFVTSLVTLCITFIMAFPSLTFPSIGS